jgi:hypothetical protein
VWDIKFFFPVNVIIILSRSNIIMSSYTSNYTNYLGARRCCELQNTGLAGPIGPQGIPGIRGSAGVTGYTGPQGPTGRSCRGPTGPKSFIVDHPLNAEKYLVHACLEGPEAGVYYRGKGEIIDGTSVTIQLPDYVSKLARNFTIQVTSIYSKERREPNLLQASEVENNEFKVYGNNGKFYWIVYGLRNEILVEPDKGSINVNGDGPYKWI